ncbi:MAG: hypothetical protein J6J62_00120 [Oscillospiraceae bacterium]|nr:hypothetical protein [Oscillospiraceae bacterium]
MENSELVKRAEDLTARCDRGGVVTHTGFLSPAERYELEQWAKRSGTEIWFFGGNAECERTAAFFLPYYMDSESFDASEYIKAIKLTAHFGTPGHRDYMGALLGMGIGREWLGDIWVHDNEAYVFCQPSVLRHLLSIDKVGRYGVTAAELALDAVPAPKREVKSVSFSVMSPRLDAVTAGIFKLSRTEAAKHIAAGNVSVNYSQCLKVDLTVHEGDIISLRGAGKAKLTGSGGTSRKGRLFVYADVYK